MKKLILVLLLFSIAYPQTIINKKKKEVTQKGYELSYDGSTEYLSVTPVAGSLDLNGAERITTETNRTFETSLGNWAAHGNHSIYRSTVGKRSGTYALAIVSSGAGDSTTNYVDIPISAFTRLVNGEKYTKELWAKDSSLTNTTLSVAIGDKKASYTNVNATYAKKVFNYQATSATVGQTIRVYLNQATTVYLDDMSLTRFYPTSISGWFKTGTSGADATFISKQTGTAATGYGYQIRLAASNTLRVQVNDGNTSISKNTTTTFTDNLWHYYTVIFDYNLLTILVDDQSPVTETLTTGNCNNVQNYTIGKYSYASSAYFAGSLGEYQHLKDYAKTQAEHLAEYRNGMKTYNQQMLRMKLKGSTASEMLKDYSGMNQTINSTNIDLTDRARATYKSK